MVLLVCRLHTDTMTDDSQEIDTWSRHQFRRGRSSYKKKTGSEIEKQFLIIQLILVETHELISFIPKDYSSFTILSVQSMLLCVAVH